MSNEAAEVPIINSLVLLHSHMCGGSGEMHRPVLSKQTNPQLAALSSPVCSLHLLADAPPRPSTGAAAAAAVVVVAAAAAVV